MSGFSDAWLALREAADHRSRYPFAPAWLNRVTRIIDLGTGTGSNLRWLAAHLHQAQRWLCVDHDRALLSALPQRFTAAAGWQVGAGVADTLLTLSGPCLAEVELLAHDFAGALPQIPPAQGQTLVAASALLDLVSHRWLTRFAEWCRALGAPGLFALTYDGRIECTPGLPDDDLVRTLMNRHQLGDKGFGPALGPRAASAAAGVFAATGYGTELQPSDWVLGPADASLQAALLSGWVDAGIELEPDAAVRLTAWREQRVTQAAAGELRLRVGHQDLLVTPPAER